MDNIILGLLLLSSRTIYQLRDRIDKGLNLMYSSMGSIQMAIKSQLAIVSILRRFVELTVNSKTAEGWTMNEGGQWMYVVNGKRTVGKKTINGRTIHFINMA